MGYRHVRVVGERKFAFEGAGLQLFVQAHTLLETVFDLQEHHRGYRTEGARAGNRDLEWCLAPGDIANVFEGCFPVLGRRRGDEGDVGRDDFRHRIAEGCTPLLQFLGDFTGETQDDPYAHVVPACAGRLVCARVQAGVSRLAGSP